MERNVYKRLTSDYVKIFHHFTEIKKKKKLQHTIKLKSDFKIKLLLTFYPSWIHIFLDKLLRALGKQP